MLINLYLARDIFQRLKAKYVSSLDDFQWQRNIRFYWNTDPLEGFGHLTVSMVETQLPYGFEYMGNTPRIIVTPVTEKGFQYFLLLLLDFVKLCKYFLQ